MIFNLTRHFAAVLGLLFVASAALSAKAGDNWSVINPTLPYGISWEDNDSTILRKIEASDSIRGTELATSSAGIITVTDIEISDFTAKRLIIYTNGDRTVATEWRLGGTRMLSPIAVYDYLRPALKIELGDPVTIPDTSVSPRQIRSTIDNDRSLYTRLRGSDFVLYTQWKVKRAGRNWIVDLRVDNESGDAILSITDQEALALVNEGNIAGERVQALPATSPTAGTKNLGKTTPSSTQSSDGIRYTNGQNLLVPTTPVGGVSIAEYIAEDSTPDAEEQLDTKENPDPSGNAEESGTQ